MAETSEQVEPAERGLLRRSSRATVAVLLGLTVLSFAQRPGRVTFDTKLDLVVAPWAFLGRALHLWNPQATFGELQNQAYGYLFPVGPFFVIMDGLAVPAWVAQRLWCALLLGAAFLGALLLARALRVGTEPARYAGALAYALAPRILTEIGPVSVEMLPAVLLPWVLLPLVRVDRFGSPWRAAVCSALAVLAMGGVNASMVLMALTLPVVWLLTRRWTADHVRLVTWWCAAVLAATLWWIVPLLLLAGYSLPFLNYIESAANTTAPLSLFQVLRGTNQWVAYVVQGEPWWPAGFLLVDNPVLMIATALVAGVGLLGLAGRALPERGFLVLGALTGLVLLAIGHVGPLDSPFAESVQRLLDGPLAPFRNVHKFDPVLRLTLALGFVHAISRPWPLAPLKAWRWQPAVAVLLVLAVAAPAWLLTLRPGRGWTEVPRYWHEAAQWLGARDATARTLMVPATGFGEYRWGRTVDEPLQALARAPWAVRSQTPLGSEGNTRFMDAVSDALADGRGSPALADYLARAGVRFVLLRNDLDTTAVFGLPPAAVLRQALARSPGVARVATFGPIAGLGPPGTLSAVDRDAGYPALEVYEVDRPTRQATVVPVADVMTVSGGPESVLHLLDQGVLRPDQATVLAGDADSPEGPWVVTDGLRRRERNVGRVHGNLSQTLADTDPVRHERPTLDLLPFTGAEHLTVAQYQGVRSVVASTSAGYADAFGETDPSAMPFAAVDGDPVSMWRSSSFTGPVGEWLEVRLDTPRVFDSVTIDFAQDIRIGWPVARIRITTDRGASEHDVPEPAGPHTYPVAGGPSATVKVTVLAMRGGRENGNVAIRELTVPGLATARLLRVPDDVAAGRPPIFAFSRGSQPRAACLTADDGQLRCDGGLARVGEEPLGIDRRLQVRTAGLYGITATALPRFGSPAWRTPTGLVASASSQLAGDPAVGVRMAFDRDPATSWLADVTDPDPTITLRWPGTRTIDSLSVDPSTLHAASPPLAVRLRAGDQVRDAVLGEHRATVSFEPLVTDAVQIALRSAQHLPLAAGDADGGATVGVSELRIPALADLLPARPATTEELAGADCGFGPQLEVDGKRYDTRVFGSQSGVAGYQRLQLLPCGQLADQGLPLTTGQHRIRALPSEEFVVHDLTLRPLVAAQPTAPRRAVTVLDWHSTLRRLQVADGPRSYLVVPENANAGWVATAGGQRLEAARIDGWQQAWVLPAGVHGTVELRFGPDRAYRAGLAIGGLAALCLVLAAVLPARRLVLAAALPVRRRLLAAALPARPRRAPAAPVASASWSAAAVAAVGLFFALAGPVALVVLLGCLVLRHVWPRALPAAACCGVLAAIAVAVSGRLSGHGQDWAYGLWSQLALLIALGAVIAAFLYPPDEASNRTMFT